LQANRASPRRQECLFTAMIAGWPYLALKHLIILTTISADAVRTSSGVFAALTLRAARN